MSKTLEVPSALHSGSNRHLRSLIYVTAAASGGWLVTDIENTTAQALAAACIAAFFVSIAFVASREISVWRPIDVVLGLTILVVFTAPYLGTVSNLTPYIRLGLGFMAGALLFAGVLPRNRSPGVCGPPILLFAIYQIIFMAESRTPGLAILRAANWLAFVPLAFLIYDRLALRRLFISAGLTTCVLLLGLILQLRGQLGGSWGGLLIEGSTYNPETSRWLQRYTSLLLNPNDFGLSMACAALACLGSLFVMEFSRVTRVMLAILAVGTLAALILSSSRGGYLAFAIGLLYIVVAARSRRLFVSLLVMVLLFPGIVMFVPKLDTYSRVTTASLGSIASGTDESASSRRELWAKNSLTDSFGGLGYGGYASDPSSLDITNRTARVQAHRAQTIDNSWLKLFLEEGVLGVGLLAAILLLASVRLWRVSLNGNRGHHVAVVVGGIVTAFIFRSISVDMLDINPWNCLLWVLVGIALSLGRPSGAGKRIEGLRPAHIRTKSGDRYPQTGRAVSCM